MGQNYNLLNFTFSYVWSLTKKHAPTNDAELCNRFVRNSHREPNCDKNDSCETVNWLVGKSHKCHQPNIKTPNIKQMTAHVLECDNIITRVSPTQVAQNLDH